MTPFSSINNIVANVDSIQTMSYGISWGSNPGGNTTGRYDIAKTGLFAGKASGGTSCWFQGNAYPTSGWYKATYFPPNGSSAEPVVFLDTAEGIGTLGGDVLLSVEEGGYIYLQDALTYSPYSGWVEMSLTGTMIYLKE